MEALHEANAADTSATSLLAASCWPSKPGDGTH